MIVIKKRGHRVAEDLTGKVFGRLTVIRRHDAETNRCVRWLTACSCGNEVIARSHSLKSGSTKSCGCYRKESKRIGTGRAMRNQLLSSYKLSAKKRNLVWSISDQVFDQLTQDRCHYCGIEPSTVKKGQRCYGAYLYNGLDRMDNTVGYLESNLVSCCKTCNVSKGTMTHTEFVTYLCRAGGFQLAMKSCIEEPAYVV